jgi:hypothetical protein
MTPAQIREAAIEAAIDATDEQIPADAIRAAIDAYERAMWVPEDHISDGTVVLLSRRDLVTEYIADKTGRFVRPYPFKPEPKP